MINYLFKRFGALFWMKVCMSRLRHIKWIYLKGMQRVNSYFHSLDEYISCSHNVIYARNVHRGIVHFHLSLS